MRTPQPLVQRSQVPPPAKPNGLIQKTDGIRIPSFAYQNQISSRNLMKRRLVVRGKHYPTHQRLFEQLPLSAHSGIVVVVVM